MSLKAESSLPSVVACLPTWNAANFIESSLVSLQAQTYPNLKILISDDASTDDTVEICRQMTSADVRVDMYVQPKNIGWVNNVNDLLHRARGTYFFVAPHDDIFSPEYVSKLVEALENDPAIILAFADTVVTHPGGQIDTRTYHQLDDVKRPVVRATKLLIRLGTWWIPFRGLFRSSALAECPGLEQSSAGEFASDWPWLLGLALRGQFGRIPRVLCRKQIRENSLSRNWNYKIASWIAVNKLCRQVINRSPLSPAGKLFLQLVSTMCVPRHLLELMVVWLKRQWKQAR